MLRIGRLHCILDMSKDKDRGRDRKGNSEACLAVILRLPLNVAQMHSDKRPLAASSCTPCAVTTSSST